MPELGPQRQIRRPLIVIASLVGILVLLAIYLTNQNQPAPHQEPPKHGQTGPAEKKIEVAVVQRSKPERDLVLTGETRPFYSVPLFSRVSGYLTRLTADLGDNVRQGQILAKVDSPEAEQAYNSARAEALSRQRIANHMRQLLRRKKVSPQEAEQAFAAAEIAEANLRAQAIIRGYQSITAPFDGRITQRLVDPGALIQNASRSESAIQPLFTISQINRLRIFASVDQKDAPFVRTGDKIEVTLPDQPGERFEAQITRTAGELDPKTHTLLAEAVLENPDQKIIPGSSVQVKLTIAAPSLLELPVKALIIKDEQNYVPVVQNDGAIHFAKIDLAENDGLRLLIRSGVQEGERVALNAGNSLQEGQRVQPVMPGQNPQAGQAQEPSRAEKQ